MVWGLVLKGVRFRMYGLVFRFLGQGLSFRLINAATHALPLFAGDLETTT